MAHLGPDARGGKPPVQRWMPPLAAAPSLTLPCVVADGTRMEQERVFCVRCAQVIIFTDQLSSLSKQIVHDAQDAAWGDHANELADILRISQLLNLVDRQYCASSNGVFIIVSRESFERRWPVL